MGRELVERVLQTEGFEGLNPVQRQAVRKGLLKGKNLVVASPTASGKTLIAKLAGLRSFKEGLGKMIYTVPLVALAREKYEDFRAKYEPLGIRVAMSVGDYDSVTGDQEIIIKERDEIKRIKIGELVNEILRKKGFHQVKGKEVCENVDGIEVLALTKNGKIEFKQVKAFIRHKINKPIYEVETRTGRKIKVTSDHSLFVLDESSLTKSVEVSSIRVGKTYIAVPAILPSTTSKTEFDLLDCWQIFGKCWIKGKPIKDFVKKIWDRVGCDSKKYWWKKYGVLPIENFMKYRHLFKYNQANLILQKGGHGKLPLKIPLDKDFLSFIGLWLADGSYGSGGTISISCGFSKECKDVVRKIADRFGISACETDDGATLIMTSRLLKKVMKDVLGLRGISRTKRVPEKIFSLSNKQIKFLLRGYFSGDGSVTKGEVVCDSVSANLLKDIQTLLLRFGIISRISWKGKRLRIPRKWSILFKEKIGFLQKYQNEKIKAASGFSRYEIIPLSTKFMRACGLRWMYYTGRALPTKYIIRKLLPNIQNKKDKTILKKIISSDIIWDKVVKIKKIPVFNDYVYDLSVPPSENFVCENIIARNSSDPWLGRYDWILLTNEKADSLIRHGAPWIKDVGLVVIDEIHMLTDPSRGPTLEVLLTRLRDMLPHAQYLVLSATIRNAREIAEWLDADVITSDWRPVKLYAGAAFPWRIKFLEKEGRELNPDLPIEASIAQHVLKFKKQALFFVATRRSAESLAEKLSKLVKQHLGKKELEALRRLADEVENVLEVPTKQCRRVARCIRGGTSFHHAGLLYRQKSLIEQNFIDGLIKILVATPTLAYGINTPSFSVIMRDLKRYYPGVGAVFIPILEVHQMLGRAGRPTFDEWGEGILLARSEEEAEELVQRYLLGEPEEITSKLGAEPMLRMHILALIASEAVRSEKGLLEFFSKTFFAFQYGDVSRIGERILDAVDLLREWGFIARRDERLKATRIGKRVSELYIDPLTAHHFILCLERALTTKTQPFSYLHVISNTPEMQPMLQVRTGEWSELDEEVAKREELFLQEIPDRFDLEYDDFLRSIKTALMFDAWINEATEDEILARFRCTPGELYTRLRNADWLVYALQEIALLLGYKPLLREIRKLRVRVQHGVKEELVPLVRLKQVGRVRARALYKAGLKNLRDLKKISYEGLSRLLGPRIAATIKEQLGQKVRARKAGQRKL